MSGSNTVEQRVAIHSALADPIRLAIVDELWCSDRAPIELRRHLGIESNLLAHHLDVLELAGLIERLRSSGDGRRRYIRLLRKSLIGLHPGTDVHRSAALFVCSANSARSRMAAALWTQATGQSAISAGTHPVDRVHPGAVAAAKRAGLDLGSSKPQDLAAVASLPPLTITVCDQAHEEIGADSGWLHWSIQDPVGVGTAAAFDDALAELTVRVQSVAHRPADAS